jgi:hypothetical protein
MNAAQGVCCHHRLYNTICVGSSTVSSSDSSSHSIYVNSSSRCLLQLLVFAAADVLQTVLG